MIAPDAQAMLFPGFIDSACAAYLGELKRAIDSEFDLLTVRGYYEEIAAIIGGEAELEAWNTAIKAAFLGSTHMQVYLQGAINSITDLLRAPDKESSQPIFSLLLDLPSVTA